VILPINNYLISFNQFIFACSDDWLTTVEATNEDKMTPEGIIMHYRGIYLLNQEFNFGFGKIFVPCLKILLIFVFISCLFAVVRFRTDLDGLSLTMISITLVTSASLTIPISIIMSSLYSASSQFKQHMIPVLSKISDKTVRKHIEGQLKSCPLIRCQVGNLYHMEAKAKLTMLEHVVNGYVFLMVNTGPKH